MIKTAKIVSVFIALLVLLPGVVTASALGEGETLQPFSAQDMNGQNVDLSTSIGKKPIMLVFWASWCPNCKTEVPKVNALVQKYQARGMVFLGINVGYNDSPGRAQRFINKTGMTYPVIFDGASEISSQYAVQGVPTVLIADRKGLIVFRGFGIPDISDNQFLELSQ